MVVPSAGSVVLVPFPFSDLSQSKLRPAVVLADAGQGDWILCQVTSSPYSDAVRRARTPVPKSIRESDGPAVRKGSSALDALLAERSESR